jgi:hypothetical protein
MIRTATTRLIALVLIAFAAPSMAHHSFRSQYDPDQPVNLTGVVTKVEWMNPHVYFYIDVKDPDSGEMRSWALEMGPPHLLQKAGWKRNSMLVGDVVNVQGTRARDGSMTANARRVTLTKTGEVLGAASSQGQTIIGKRNGDN